MIINNGEGVFIQAIWLLGLLLWPVAVVRSVESSYPVSNSSLVSAVQTGWQLYGTGTTTLKRIVLQSVEMNEDIPEFNTIKFVFTVYLCEMYLISLLLTSSQIYQKLKRNYQIFHHIL